jgi:DNA-binding XRE family transcriptional regulator
MTRKFSELYNKMPPATRDRVETRVVGYKAEMALEDLRRDRKLTQVDLARNLGIAQGAVSKIEKRGDMHVGTLRKHIEAMGGSLQLRAIFPDAEVSLRLRGSYAEIPARSRGDQRTVAEVKKKAIIPVPKRKRA